MQFSDGGYYHVVRGKWHNLGRVLNVALEEYHKRELGRLKTKDASFRLLRLAFLRDGTAELATRTVKDYTKHLALWGEALDDVLLEDIKPSDIFTLHKRAVAKRGAVQANREKAAVSLAWNWGRRTDFTALPNPCTGIHRARERSRSVLVSDTVYRRVWVHADWPTRNAMDLARYSGQRPADVFKTVITDVKGDELRIEQGKTGVVVRLVLEGRLGKTVTRLLAIDNRVGTPLLCNERGDAFTYSAFDNRFEDACKRAGVRFQFRDLRAKAGTRRAEEAGKEAAQDLLGHASVKTTEIYVRRHGRRVKGAG